MSFDCTLPESWYWSTLDDVKAEGRSIVSGPFGSNIGSRFFVDTGVPVIRGNNLSLGMRRFKDEGFVFLTEEKATEFKNCEAHPGDILFTAAGTIGQVGIIPPNGKHKKYIISNKQLRARLDSQKVAPLFAYYWFASPEMVSAIQSRNTGSTIPLINLSVIKSLPIPVPPLCEQTRIVEQLSLLDERINHLRETNATLEAIAQALFKSWFVDFDPVHAKMEGRIPEGMDEVTAALFPDGFEESELGAVPRGWVPTPVYNLALYINGAAYKAFEPNLERRGLPIIKIAELKAGVTTQTAYSDVAMPEKYCIEIADILFSWSGNPDTSIDTFVWTYDKAWLNQHIFRVLPHAVHERSFVLRTLKYLRPVFAELARNKQTTGLGHVTVADLKRLQVLKPDKALLENFDSVISPIHELMFNNDQAGQTLAAIRDKLLPRLISGQLSIPTAESEIDALAA